MIDGLKVEGKPNLVRTSHCAGVIVNTDQEGFEQFTRVRDRQQARDDRQESLEKQIQELSKLLQSGSVNNG